MKIMIPCSKRNWNSIFKIISPVFPKSHNEGCSKLLHGIILAIFSFWLMDVFIVKI